MHTYGKLLGALLLLVSVAFPMSTCSHYENAEGKIVQVAEGETPPEGVTKVIDHDYAFETFHPLDPGDWVRVLAFAWPVLAVAILHRRKRGAIALGVRVFEPLLIAGSIYLVHFISTFLAERRATGAYLAFLALGIYSIATLWADIEVYREWKKRRT
jgi:hypothetical protein